MQLHNTQTTTTNKHAPRPPPRPARPALLLNNYSYTAVIIGRQSRPPPLLLLGVRTTAPPQRVFKMWIDLVQHIMSQHYKDTNTEENPRRVKTAVQTERDGPRRKLVRAGFRNRIVLQGGLEVEISGDRTLSSRAVVDRCRTSYAASGRPPICSVTASSSSTAATTLLTSLGDA